MHIGRGDDLLILRTVGREGDAAVEEHLEVRPHLFKVFFARYLEHAHQHRQHPRGNARQVGNILLDGFVRNAVAFHLKVGEQGRLLFRCAHQVYQRVDIFDEDGAEVAHQRARQVIVGRV